MPPIIATAPAAPGWPTVGGGVVTLVFVRVIYVMNEQAQRARRVDPSRFRWKANRYGAYSSGLLAYSRSLKDSSK